MQKLVWQNANGEEIDLTKDPFGITKWEGFSNTGLNIQTQTVPFSDGAVYLDALLNQRELSVTLAINDENDLYKRYELKRKLIAALNPKMGEGYLIYTNDYLSKRIKCVAQLPVFPTKNSDTKGTQKASLTWVACEPYWEDVEEKNIFIKQGMNHIVNNGDIDTGFILNIMGNIQKMSLINVSKKLSIEYNGSTPLSGLQINTNLGSKEVYSLILNSEISINKKFSTICFNPVKNVYYTSFDNDTPIYETSDFIYYKVAYEITDGQIKNVATNERMALYKIDNDKLLKINFLTNTIEYFQPGFQISQKLDFSQKYQKFIDKVGTVLYMSEDGEIWDSIETSENGDISIDVDTGDVYFWDSTKLYKISNLETWTKDILGDWGSMGITDGDVTEILIASKIGVIKTTSGDYRIINNSYESYYFCEAIEDDFFMYLYSKQDKAFIGVRKSTNGNNASGIEKSFNLENWITICNFAESADYCFGVSIAYTGLILFEFDSKNIYYGYSTAEVQLKKENRNVSFVIYDEYYEMYYVVIDNHIYSTTDFKTYILRFADENVAKLETNNKGIILGFCEYGIIYTIDGINFQKKPLTEDYYYSYERTENVIAYSPTLCQFMAVTHVGSNSYKRIFISDNLEIDTYEFSLVIESEIGDIKWCSGWGKFLLVPGYSTADGTHFEFMGGIHREKFIIYSSEKNMALFLSGDYSEYGISFDGESVLTYEDVFDNYNYNVGAYNKDLKLFLVADNNSLYYTSDGLNWGRINGVNAVYIDEKKKFSVSDFGVLQTLAEKKEKNLISYLSTDSDFSTSITKGDNNLIISVSPDTLTGHLTYRQKYVGV